MNYSWGGAYLEIIMSATHGKKEDCGQLVPDSAQGKNVMLESNADLRYFVVYPEASLPNYATTGGKNAGLMLDQTKGFEVSGEGKLNQNFSRRYVTRVFWDKLYTVKKRCCRSVSRLPGMGTTSARAGQGSKTPYPFGQTIQP